MDERWGILQQEKEKGEALTYVFKKDNIQIFYPFIKRKAGLVEGVQYFDLVTPRGQCGPWLENCDISKQSAFVNAFDEEFEKYCARENIVAEYIRFNPWIEQSNVFENIYDIRFYGFIYCNDLTCDFFTEEYSYKVRQSIRKAEKDGVEIIFDTAGSSVDDFLRLYSFTESKYSVNDYYTLERHFIEKYCNIFPKETIFGHAVYKGEIISSLMLLMGEDIAHNHYAGSHPKYKSLQGNSLLIYKASLYAAQKGKKLFDLGGAKAGSELERFKFKFAQKAKKYPYYIGTKIRNKNIYDKLVEQAGGPREGYFPSYRI